MTLWRLEWLRLVRTRRLAALIGVYAFLGIVGPLTARYLGEIIDRFGSDITVIVPDPVPADGIAQYVANASQIGLLVAVAVAAGALVLDAVPEMSIFLRTRVPSARALVVPRFVTVTAAAAAAYAIGLGFAWYETAVLLGGLPIAKLAAGLGLAVVYLAFAVAVVATFGARLRGTLATVGVALVTLLIMPIVGLIDPFARWLPSHLVGAQAALLTGAPIGDFLPATVVAASATALLVTDAIRATSARDL